jgi:hypothetical protein
VKEVIFLCVCVYVCIDTLCFRPCVCVFVWVCVYMHHVCVCVCIYTYMVAPEQALDEVLDCHFLECVEREGERDTRVVGEGDTEGSVCVCVCVDK